MKNWVHNRLLAAVPCTVRKRLSNELTSAELKSATHVLVVNRCQDSHFTKRSGELLKSFKHIRTGILHVGGGSEYCIMLICVLHFAPPK